MAALVLIACATDDAVARIGHRSLRRSELEARFGQLEPKSQDFAEGFGRFVGREIEREVLYQEALRRGLSTEDPDKRAGLIGALRAALGDQARTQVSPADLGEDEIY